MNWKILSHPLGMSASVGIPCKKEIPLAIPAVLAAGSLASSLFGASKSREAAEEAMEMQRRERERIEAERYRKVNENYIDTAAGQNMMRIAKEQADKIWRRAEGAKAVAGGTDAAAAMAKEQGNKMVGDTIANMAAQDTARKDAIDASYRADLARANQGIMQTKSAQADATAQAAGAASNAMMQGALMTFGGTKLGQSWFGTGNGTGAAGQLNGNYNWLKNVQNPWAGASFG